MNVKVLGAILLAALVALGGAFALTNTKTEKGAVDSSQNNEQDVQFAQMMIPHHEQAIEMAALADSRSQNTEVRALAKKIQAAQGPEIETMKGWLSSWNKPAEASNSDSMAGHNMDAMDAGSMTEEEMTQLNVASGAAFDKMFLEMMIRHHEGAIKMARTQESSGRYGPAVDLARKIIADQEAEIEEIKKLQQAI